ncbi:MAG: ATP-dependent DNA helicase RecQ [Deltaproteobacteria bacterium]|nr:ATP-dependent DNA helicase RecQ [Deltaproteobacteria bacterium]MBW2416899.1 ATP-dependent DNA helicase RecQ [Deltaproteobacteria bacterium]
MTKMGDAKRKPKARAKATAKAKAPAKAKAKSKAKAKAKAKSKAKAKAKGKAKAKAATKRPPVVERESSRGPTSPQPSSSATAPRAVDTVTSAAARLGIERLHVEQEQVVSEVLAGRDVLMILPTGFGKSACYQIPAMVLSRPVVMISPLIALLRDQHRILLERDIDSVRIDGSVRGRARREALERIAAGGPLLVMTTPETLAVEDVSQVLAKTGIGLAAVDEAHCISEWGYDFRPAYQRLGPRLRALGGPPIMALTATATPRVRDTIVRSLGMREPRVVASSPHRSNLAFEVIQCEGDMRPRALLRLVQRLRRPGIVYCATRREVDMAHALLRRFKVPAHRYHGAMTAKERNDEQAHFMRPRYRAVMVATNAFGLGIDKPDIRYILHYQAPASLEQYVQEAGRGGRDGRKSNCLFLHDPSDRAIHEALLARSRIRPDQLYQLGTALAAWAAEGRSPTLEALALSAELGPRITSALLAKMEEAGLVESDDAQVRVLASSQTIEADVRSLAGQFETLKTQDARRLDALQEYARITECRALFLRAYFGEEADAPCGLCDICRGAPTRPESFFAAFKAPESSRKNSRKKKKKGARKGRRRGRRTARASKTEETEKTERTQRTERTERTAKQKQTSGEHSSTRKAGRKRGRRRRGRRRKAPPR